MGLGAAIGALVTERAWELPAAGATLRERWEAIAPELAGRAFAVGYDADSGRLTVCPESSAWATKVRLEQARIIAAANASAGRTVVRGLRILAPGSVPAPAPDDGVVQAPEAPKGPAKTRESASYGYHRALTAHRQAAPPRLAAPDITEAVERQTRAMRELSRRAFPEPEAMPDDAPAALAAVRARRRREGEASHAAALRKAREDRAARNAGAVAAPGPVQQRSTA
ncbi:DUF721 domain-containing protein [Streptomyces sp. NPDC001027]|uniref:DUF721 domain-containing protein n=1 Tax=Streptomyces sp. NPDC001027 TaxID=3154771 RepID=UPI0033261BC5